MRQACPQLGEADVRAFGRYSGFDPNCDIGADISRLCNRVELNLAAFETERADVFARLE